MASALSPTRHGYFPCPSSDVAFGYATPPNWDALAFYLPKQHPPHHNRGPQHPFSTNHSSAPLREPQLTPCSQNPYDTWATHLPSAGQELNSYKQHSHEPDSQAQTLNHWARPDSNILYLGDSLPTPVPVSHLTTTGRKVGLPTSP